MLPVVLAITHTLTTYYIFSGLAVKGLRAGVLRARGAAAPGPAVLGARNWWEWLAGYRSVRGPHLAQHPGPH